MIRLTRVLAVLSLVFLSSCTRYEAEQATDINPQDPKETEVDSYVTILFYETTSASIEIKVKDENVINSMILAPMASASIDETPAKRVIIGTLVYYDENRVEKIATLFQPFGYFKCDGDYQIADFGELEEYLTEQLRYCISEFEID